MAKFKYPECAYIYDETKDDQHEGFLPKRPGQKRLKIGLAAIALSGTRSTPQK